MSDRAPRYHELDWLRFLAVLFVVALHFAQTYTHSATDSLSQWTVRSETLGTVLGATGYFRMPVLFCVAGMATMHTRGRRSLGAYLHARAERLLLPLVLGLGLIVPLQRAFEGELANNLSWPLVWSHSWGHFWFLGALVTITVLTLPLGAWLDRPTVQARIAQTAHNGRSLIVLGGLPLAAALLPTRWVGADPAIGHVDMKALIGYGAMFAAGMVLASAPAFRETVLRCRRAALSAWIVLAAFQFVASRVGVDGHVLVVVSGVTTWAWVLACYGFAIRYLAAPSPVLAKWAPRALAVYALHNLALAEARCIVLPLDLPLFTQVALLAAVTVAGTLTLVLLAESFRQSAYVLGLRYVPQASPRLGLQPVAGAVT